MGDLHAETIGDFGEKKLISEIIRPTFNPSNNPNLAGDDCAVFEVPPGSKVCVSTDRVPADLISFKLGILDYRQLGYYLAVLNLSDLAAMGADPVGLLLNLGLPRAMKISSFRLLIAGVQSACRKYNIQVMGGDISSASELSISATSIGQSGDKILRRTGTEIGDRIYCSSWVGLTATAFKYFLDAKPQGLLLPDDLENLLNNQFREPAAAFDTGRCLRGLARRVSAMDNTDGFGQTLLELANINSSRFVIEAGLLPIHPVTYQVADFLEVDAISLALGPGADFQIMGTVDAGADDVDVLSSGITLIGTVTPGQGVARMSKGLITEENILGWNYFATAENSYVKDEQNK